MKLESCWKNGPRKDEDDLIAFKTSSSTSWPPSFSTWSGERLLNSCLEINTCGQQFWVLRHHFYKKVTTFSILGHLLTIPILIMIWQNIAQLLPWYSTCGGNFELQGMRDHFYSSALSKIISRISGRPNFLASSANIILKNWEYKNLGQFWQFSTTFWPPRQTLFSRIQEPRNSERDIKF